MTLRELKAEFVKWDGYGSYHEVETLAEADGIREPTNFSWIPGMSQHSLT